MGIGTTLGVVGGTLAGSLGGAALESNAAGNAASTQAKSANLAAELQAEEAQQGLNLQAGEYNNALDLALPGVYAGDSALANLEYGLGITPQGSEFTPNALQPGQITFPGTNQTIGGAPAANYPSYSTPTGQPVAYQAPQIAGQPQSNVISANPKSFSSSTGAGTPLSSLVSSTTGFGSLDQPWNQTFTAPTEAQAAQTPGYQFTLNQGEQAVDNGAAARGNLLSGNTLNAENQYAQGLADTTYNDVYNRALNTYNTNYNTFENNQANQFNRLASLLGAGQNTTNNLSSTGVNTANSSANTLLTAGQQIGQNINNAGAATASGYIGSANAYGGALSGLGNNLTQLLALQNLLNGNSNSTGQVTNIGT